MLILEDFGGGLGVVEQLVDFFYLLPLHGLFALNTAQQTGWRQQLYSIPERKQEVRAAQDKHIHGESGKDRHHFSTTYIFPFLSLCKFSSSMGLLSSEIWWYFTLPNISLSSLVPKSTKIWAPAPICCYKYNHFVLSVVIKHRIRSLKCIELKCWNA